MFKALVILAALQLTAAVFPAVAAPPSPSELKVDKVVYHWTTWTMGRKFLARKGQLPNDIMYRIMYGGLASSVYGPGLYVDEDPTLWLSRGQGTFGGALLEITIPKGSRVIEFSDEHLVKTLMGNTVETSNFLHNVHLMRDGQIIAVRHNNGVKVTRFTGRYLPVNTLISLNYDLRARGEYFTSARINRSIRKELRARARKDKRLLEISAVRDILEAGSMMDSCVGLLLR